MRMVRGVDAFEGQPAAISSICLAIHVSLHASSFRFHLPAKRNPLKPMIWPEFRMHNAIFATRNLLGAALGIWLVDLVASSLERAKSFVPPPVRPTSLMPSFPSGFPRTLSRPCPTFKVPFMVVARKRSPECPGSQASLGPWHVLAR